MRNRGLPVRNQAAAGPRIGVLTSRSGPGNLFAAAVCNVADLAVDEIKTDGGINGQPVELLIADDATDPGTGVLEAHRLVRSGCDTIFLATTSATYEAVSSALQDNEVLVVQSNMNEGGGESPLRIHLGERPRAQLDVAAAPLMRAAGGRRWFLAGNDYVWPRTVNSVARSVLPEHGAIVVGEQHVALGAGDFGPIIEQITATGADIVLNTFVGADGAAFERQCHAMGLCDRTLSLGPAMDEATLERIGERASQGILRCLLPALADRTQRNPAPAVPGQLRPLGTATVDTVRVDLRSDPRLGRAALRIRSTEPRNVADEIRRGHFEVPRGTIALEGNHHGHQQLYLAAAHSATFESMTDATTRH